MTLCLRTVGVPPLGKHDARILTWTVTDKPAVR
jgi:hypothetical protein